jgi:tetratricopeptide (TPR) repeat protein
MLLFAILFMVVLALVVFLFGLLGGYIGRSTPRTLVESQLLTLKNSAVAQPTSGAARQAYILALEASGQRGAAWSEYKRALKQVTAGERTQVYVAGVDILFGRKDYKGTVKLAKEAIAYDDAARKEYTDSMAKKGITISNVMFNQTARIAILFTSARASGALKDWKTAVDRLTEALALDPEGSDLLTFRASAYEHLGQKDKAIADYKAALAFIPDYQAAVDGLKRLQGK